ncbi:hypothetical protein [Actinocorallia longicatena]|uniref:Uncharacterized protein n=1 Tax=Actinocorallia longicatena TaxID=111803 RepID=A0ABP6QJZ1_9ACTN
MTAAHDNPTTTTTGSPRIARIPEAAPLLRFQRDVALAVGLIFALISAGLIGLNVGQVGVGADHAYLAGLTSALAAVIVWIGAVAISSARNAAKPVDGALRALTQATTDLRRLREETAAHRQETRELRRETAMLRAEIADARKEIVEEMAELRRETTALRADIADARKEIVEVGNGLGDLDQRFVRAEQSMKRQIGYVDSKEEQILEGIDGIATVMAAEEKPAPPRVRRLDRGHRGEGS